MQLHLHVLENRGSREAAFEICAMLRAKRAFLPLKDFLEGSNAKKKFEKWAAESKTAAAQAGEVD